MAGRAERGAWTAAHIATATMTDATAARTMPAAAAATNMGGTTSIAMRTTAIVGTATGTAIGRRSDRGSSKATTTDTSDTLVTASAPSVIPSTAAAPIGIRGTRPRRSRVAIAMGSSKDGRTRATGAASTRSERHATGQATATTRVDTVRATNIS